MAPQSGPRVLSLPPPPWRREETSLSSDRAKTPSLLSSSLLPGRPPHLLFSGFQCLSKKLKATSKSFHSSPSTGQRPTDRAMWSRAFQGTAGQVPQSPRASLTPFPFGTDSITATRGREGSQTLLRFQPGRFKVDGRGVRGEGRPRTQVGGEEGPNLEEEQRWNSPPPAPPATHTHTHTHTHATFTSYSLNLQEKVM